MTSTLTALTAEAGRPDPSKWVGPGLLCLLVIVLLALGTVLLWRNMNKQLKKIDFDEGEPGGKGGTGGADGRGGNGATDQPATSA